MSVIAVISNGLVLGVSPLSVLSHGLFQEAVPPEVCVPAPPAPRFIPTPTYSLLPCDPCKPFWVADATYTLTCPEGKVGSITVRRQALSTYSLKHAQADALSLAKADAAALIQCENPELQPFDFAVLRYIWTSEAGDDLDTRTAVVAPSRGFDVGWDRLPSDPGDETLPSCSTNPFIATGGPFYLAHGGDNCDDGVEAVLLDFDKLTEDFAEQETFSIRMRAFWYATKLTGTVTLQFQTYLGGTMSHDGYDFVNTGGTAVQTIAFDVAVAEETASNADGQDVAVLNYDVATKTAELVIA